MADDFLSIINAAAGSLTPVSGRATALASSVFSPSFRGVPGESDSPVSEPPVQWGPSLVLVRDHTAICGGQYGVKKNNCFCCANASQDKACPTKHYILKNLAVTDSAALRSSRIYFHKGSSSNAAFAYPFLDATKMDSMEISAMLGRTFESWDVWREEALVVKAAHDSKQQVEVIRTAIKTTKTLPRLASGSGELQGSGLGLELDLGERLKLLGTAMEELQKRGELKPALASQFEEDDDNRKNYMMMMERINLLQEAVMELHETKNNGVKELQLGMAVRLAGVEAILGSLAGKAELRQDQAHDGSTIADILEDLQNQLDSLKGTEFIKMVAQQVFKSEDMDKHMESMRAAFRVVMKRIVSLEERADSTQASWKAPTLDTGWLSGKGTESGEQDTYQDRLTSLGLRVDALEQTTMPGGKSEGEDIVVSFMGIRFASEEDVRMYVEALGNGRFEIPVGLMTDCYSIFHALNREIFDAKNKLTMVDLAKVSQLGTKQADVYNLLAAAEHGLPNFFDSSSSAGKIFIDGKQGKKHRFSNIASYEIWGPVGTIKDAVRKRAEGQLTRLVRTQRNDLKEVWNPELRAFLTAMLDTSKEFVEAVFSFLTEEYSALAEHFEDEVLCWDFACSCVEHVFKYEFEAARAVINNPDVGDKSIPSKVLWQSLRTIAIQESFLRVGFKNHSSLASAYSRFLLTQYQKAAQELSRVSKEAETYKRKFEDFSGLLEGMDKRIRAAEGTANAAKNAIERVAKRGAT